MLASQETSDEQEKEREMTDCCVSKENGFKCTCLPKNKRYGQQAEDDGFADYEMENKRDRDDEDRKLEDDADREMGDER